MKKIVYIKLKRSTRIDPSAYPSPAMVEFYVVEQLRNAARVSIEGPINGRRAITHFRVGDSVTHSQADALCDNRNYEVTVTV